MQGRSEAEEGRQSYAIFLRWCCIVFGYIVEMPTILSTDPSLIV